MKAFNLTLSLLMILMLPGPVLAEKGGKGPSDKAYESASEKASFKREEGKPGKAGKAGKDTKNDSHTHDDEAHEHPEQSGTADDTRERRHTEREQGQTEQRERDGEREQRQRSGERTESTGTDRESAEERDGERKQRQRSDERAESSGTDRESTEESKSETGFWKRLFGRDGEKRTTGE
ncbi:MAG: hypothetical protein OEU91_10600 [Gammaproteobacteria bacterium]|nr:hypothetical protein [Gammaproteobacteria bacterium]